MQRKLSSVEALLWAGGQTLSIFAMVATVRGKVTAAALYEALNKLRLRHPLLAIRLFLDDESTLSWTTENVGDFQIRRVERTNADTWIDAIKTDLQIPFNGPFVRFMLISSGESSDSDVCELGIVCHHGFADGLSGAYLMRDLLTYLGDPNRPVDSLPVPPSHDDIAAMTLMGSVGEPFAGVKITQLPENAPLEALDNLFLLPWSLDEMQTSALVSRSREKSVSVHGIVCAALLKAFAEEKNDSSCAVSSPVNLRPYSALPIGEAFGLFIHPALLAKVDCQRDLWEIAAEIVAQTQAQITKENLFQTSLTVRHLMRTMPYQEALAAVLSAPWDMNYDVSVSNLGRLDFRPNTFGDLKLEALYGPMVLTKIQETVFGLNSVNNRIFFSWVGRHNILEPAKAMRLRDGMMKHLLEVIN